MELKYREMVFMLSTIISLSMYLCSLKIRIFFPLNGIFVAIDSMKILDLHDNAKDFK